MDDRDLTINNQSALKELSTSVAKMISKKVDRSDVSRLIHEYANGIVMDKSSTRETPGNRRSSKSPTFSDRHSSPSPTSIFQGHHTTSSTRSGGNSLKLKTPYRGNEQQEEYDSLEEEIVEQKSGKTKNLHQKQNKLLQSYTALQKDYQVLLEKVELCQQDINQFKEGMSQELSIMKRRYMENSANTSGSRSSRGDPAIIPPSSSMYTDWRIALGELSLNLRREMSEKCGREEMRSALGIELNLIEKKLHVR